MYYELGTGNSATATLNFNFGSAASSIRQFEVKVTQIPCAASYRPPSGCFQYHQGLTGRFQTFNFQDTATQHLANQNYDICIRQEDGYCCVQYSPCADPNSYTLDELAIAAEAEVGTLCSLDYIEIDGRYRVSQQVLAEIWEVLVKISNLREIKILKFSVKKIRQIEVRSALLG